MSKETVVIALGGNALQMQGEAPTVENQNKNVRIAAKQIALLIKEGFNVIITHGNGPQIGRLLIQQANANSDETPGFPFDQCSALSQASIGYSIQQILKEELLKIGIDKTVGTIITQTEVDQNDPAFDKPTKPIGPFYTKEEADKKADKNNVFVEDSGRGYRQVVPSPMPKSILEQQMIEDSMQDSIVVCCGGGGIPVVVEGDKIKGTPAVIDKDRATSLLAQNIKADKLIILTAVAEAKINYGKENEESIYEIEVNKVKEILSEFGEGSMKPKVEACIDFTEKTGNISIITDIDNLTNAINSEKIGTKIIKKC